MAGGSASGILQAGQSEELSAIALAVASVASEVDAMSVHDQAEVEIKQEEHQRLLGIVPNFYVAYNWNSAPLDTKQKFKLAAFNVIDPVNIGIDAAIAGYQQWQGDFSGYGPGLTMETWWWERLLAEQFCLRSCTRTRGIFIWVRGR